MSTLLPICLSCLHRITNARPQALAEQALHSLQAAKASPSPLVAGKENADGTPGPYSHRRVSPGHFLVHPTLRSPMQQPSGSATGALVPLGGMPATQPLGTPHNISGGSAWAGRTYAPPPSPASGPTAATPQQAGQEQQAVAGAAAAATPLSQQGSRVSSALVDNLNLALRALGEQAGVRSLPAPRGAASALAGFKPTATCSSFRSLPPPLPPLPSPAGHAPTQRAGHAATPTSRLQPVQPSCADATAGSLAALRLGAGAGTPPPLLLPAPGAAAATPSGSAATPGSASQRLADLQQRHAQLLADIDAAERRRTEAQAAATQAEGEAAAAQDRLSAAAQQAREREAAVAALAAEEAAARERLAGLADSMRQQEEAAQCAQQEAGTTRQQLEAVR